MRVGMSVGTRLQTADVDAGWRLILEQASAARRAGLDVITVGDQHSTGPQCYLQNIPVVARILADWDERPAGCMFLVPLWHPVLMAEQIGTLASLARGPFVVQVGAGGGVAQFRGMGVELADRGQLVDEGLALVRALLRGERGRSDRWAIEGAQVAPVPKRGLQWWVGGGSKKAVERAARLGDCWYAAAGLTRETAAETCRAYHAACDECGRTDRRMAIRRDVFVADSPSEASRVGQAWVKAGYRGFDPAAVSYGDPERVAEQLSVYGELGFTDIMIRTIPASPEAMVRSVELTGQVRSLLRGEFGDAGTAAPAPPPDAHRQGKSAAGRVPPATGL